MLKKLIIPMGVSLAVFSGTLWLSGALSEKAAGALIDPPSLLISVIAPLLLVTISFGLAKTRRAFSAPVDPDADDSSLRIARAYFRNLLRYIIAYSVFALSIGFIMIMAFSKGGDTSSIGTNLAISMLSIFYGSVFPIFILLPYLTIIDGRLAE